MPARSLLRTASRCCAFRRSRTLPRRHRSSCSQHCILARMAPGADERKPDTAETSSAVLQATTATVPFKRRFVVPAVVLALLELVAIGYPLWVGFDLGDLGADTLLRTVVPVAIGAGVVWYAAVVTWFLPLWAAVAARRRGERVNKE